MSIKQFFGQLLKKKPRSIEDMVRDESVNLAKQGEIKPVPDAESPQGTAMAPTRARVPASQKRVTTLIGRAVSFVGDIETSDSVHVSGHLAGNLVAREAQVSISTGGLVTGMVVAENVLVGGTVKGQIRARVVRLYPSAMVEGDIYCERLLTDDGACLMGRCWRLGREEPQTIDAESSLDEALATPALGAAASKVVEMPREASRAAAAC